MLEPTSNTLFIQNPPHVETLTLGKAVLLNGAALNSSASTGLDIPERDRGHDVEHGGDRRSAVGADAGRFDRPVPPEPRNGAATFAGAIPSGPSALAVGDAPDPPPPPRPPPPPPAVAPPPPPIIPPDRTAPVLSKPAATTPLTVPAKGRSLVVRGRTSCNEARALKVTGSLRIAARKSGGKRTVLNMRSASKALRAGVRGTLGATISARNLARVRSALRGRRKVTVLLSFTGRDTAGKTSAKRSVTVTLRAPKKR